MRQLAGNGCEGTVSGMHLVERNDDGTYRCCQCARDFAAIPWTMLEQDGGRGECDECGDYRWHLNVVNTPKGTKKELCNRCTESFCGGNYHGAHT